MGIGGTVTSLKSKVIACPGRDIFTKPVSGRGSEPNSFRSARVGRGGREGTVTSPLAKVMLPFNS